MTAAAKATAKTPPPNILALDDPVTHYAAQVDAGNIIAGPHVRAACKRHLRDLVEGPDRGLFWDLDCARHVIGFYPDVLVLNGGEFEGQPFFLELWQGFIVGSLFGWKSVETEKRRFQMAYVETAKGSGKSPLAAGIGLYCLVADGEQRAEVYSAATKKDQAQILFRDAVAMVDHSPELNMRLQRSGSSGKEYNLAYHKTNSFFRTLSSDQAQSGPRPHCALIDEIHEHKDGSTVEMARAGFKFRTQPLIFMITNSGGSRQIACYEYHKYAIDICKGSLKDDTFFGYVCAIDEGEDPFKSEKCWPKANPSLGVTIQPKYLRDQVTQARGLPSKESLVKRLNFCIWTEAESPWISFQVWEKASEAYDPEKLVGRRCVAAADLSSTRDLTSLVLAFEPTPEDPVTRLLSYFWIPSEGLADRQKKERRPYGEWVKAGHLIKTPGSAVSKLFVLKHLVKLDEKYDIDLLGYDLWRFEDLKQLALDEGITLPEIMPFGQGYKSMSPAVEDFETKLLQSEIKHDGNPVLTMCAANAVTTEDPAGNRKVDKAKANGRIDGIIASLMANKILSAEKPKVSCYESRGIRSL